MQQVKWNTRFNFRSAEPSEVVQFSVGVNSYQLWARDN
jgi:hypothetical protein